MIVLDASAVIEFLLGTGAGSVVAHRIASAAETLHAPHLLDLEVAQVLRRYTTIRQLEDARAMQALDDLADLDLNRYPHHVFLPRIWQLRHNTTAYDAVYLALAESLPAVLLTSDERLARVPGVKVHVDVVKRARHDE